MRLRGFVLLATAVVVLVARTPAYAMGGDFGYGYETLEQEQQNTIITGDSEIAPESDIEEADFEPLLKIAMAEAEGESTKGKALVMRVVLNRVKSDGFPDSVEKVVLEKGQFSPTAKGGRYWTAIPDNDCYKALDMVLNGWDDSKGALYFEACEGESWHSRNLNFLFREGKHKFYK